MAIDQGDRLGRMKAIAAQAERERTERAKRDTEVKSAEHTQVNQELAGASQDLAGLEAQLGEAETLAGQMAELPEDARAPFDAELNALRAEVTALHERVADLDARKQKLDTELGGAANETPKGLSPEKQTTPPESLKKVETALDSGKRGDGDAEEEVVKSGIDNRDKLIKLYASRVDSIMEQTRTGSLKRREDYERAREQSGHPTPDEEKDLMRKAQLAVDIGAKSGLFIKAADQITYVAETAKQADAASAAKEIYAKVADHLLRTSKDLTGPNSSIVLETGDRGLLVFRLQQAAEGLKKAGGDQAKVKDIVAELDRLHNEAIKNARGGSHLKAQERFSAYQQWKAKLG